MKKNTAQTFEALLGSLGVSDLEGLLYNWNESKLSPDGTEIILHYDERAFGPGTGDSAVIEKEELFAWLLSEEPFNTEVYGPQILQDAEWRELIARARKCLSQSK